MLEGKVTLVTGASQGLGRALALAFAREGARVAINSRSEEGVRPVAGEAESAGAEVLALAADVSRSADVERLAGATVERLRSEEHTSELQLRQYMVCLLM